MVLLSDQSLQCCGSSAGMSLYLVLRPLPAPAAVLEARVWICPRKLRSLQEPRDEGLCRAWAEHLQGAVTILRLKEPLTQEGVAVLRRLPALRQLELDASQMPSSVSLLQQLTLISFAASPAQLAYDWPCVKRVDLPALQGLASLRQLTLKQMDIDDLDVLLPLTQLQHLDFYGCIVTLSIALGRSQACPAALQTLHVCCDKTSPGLQRAPDERLGPIKDALLFEGLFPSLLKKVLVCLLPSCDTWRKHFEAHALCGRSAVHLL